MRTPKDNNFRKMDLNEGEIDEIPDGEFKGMIIK
jgi:hypothetical protein